MATIPTMPANGVHSAHIPEGINPGNIHAETALVPTAHEGEADNLPELAGPVARLPVELDVAVPVRDFRVRNLLALQPGQLIETEWGHGDDVPLSAGDVQLTWSEFEVVDTQLAVRITRLV